MSRRANPTLIGAFVLGGVVIAVVAVAVFGSGRMFRETRTFVSFFEGSVSGLDAGAAVRFRGIDVGEVTEVLIDLPGLSRPGEDIRIAVVYEIDRQLVESRGAGARLPDPLDMDTLFGLGIHAELATESLVTGRKFIALDLDPGNPVDAEALVSAPYPEIPAVRTGLEAIEEDLTRIVAELGAVPLDALVSVATDALGEVGALAATPELSTAIARLPATLDNLNRTVTDLRTLVLSVDSTLTPVREGFETTTAQAGAVMEQAAATMERLEATLGEVNAVLEPDAPHFVRFERAMTDLSAASRSLRSLTEYLERNPSAILRGRPGGDG